MATPDDLEAVRTIADALKSFEVKDQERIIRWARERVGLPSASTAVVSTSPLAQLPTPGVTPQHLPSGGSPPKDLKSYVAEKKPKNDVQFAATVAYF